MEEDIFDVPMYPASFAARLLRVNVNRIRRWLQGYNFAYKVGKDGDQRYSSMGSLVARKGAADSSYASFWDLIDLLFVNEFLKEEFSLQTLRKAWLEASKIVPGHHFAHRTFFTNAKSIYLEVNKVGSESAILQLLSGGQWAIAPIIKQLSHRIDFNEVSGYAEKYYPRDKDTSIVLDPKISFGSPALKRSGIRTDTIYDFYIAENRNGDATCEWFSIGMAELESAVGFEEWLKAA